MEIIVFLLKVFLFIWLIRLAFKLLLPFILKYIIYRLQKKASNGFYYTNKSNFNQNQQNNTETNVNNSNPTWSRDTSKNHTKQKNKDNNNDEYVDFEEIK